MNAWLLSIGTELTTGRTLDSNAHWLSGRLSEAGITVTGKTTLPDVHDAILAELARVAAANDFVLITGGLGPTEDDLTRFAIADAMGAGLVMDEAMLEQIRRFFAVRQREMPPANTVQARIPDGAAAIENPCGTAPGIHATIGEAEVFAMPGVPREMKRMYDEKILSHITARTGGLAMITTSVHTFGTTESEVGELISDLMARGRNPDIGTTAGGGVISVRVYARGESPEEAAALGSRDVAEVERRLSRYVFGRNEDTMASVVGGLLTEQGATVATAESCTGGLVAKMLTDVPGSSAYLIQGVVTYADGAKTRLLGVPAEMIVEHGAVSREVAEAMASGARERAGTDYALALTGIAGPGGGTEEKPVGLVHIGLASKDRVVVKEIRLGRNMPRDEIRERSAHGALNLLRLKLLKIAR